MLVYRLEDSKTELPLHWAYCDAWEIAHSLDGDYIDNRNPGFQVWGDLKVIAVAANLATADGDYDAQEYPWFHVIEAADIYDGVDEWFAVEIEDVVSVKVVETIRLVEWAKTQWATDVADGYNTYENDFASWCKDSEDEILSWLHQNAVAITPKFVETLENPYENAYSLHP